MISIFFSYISLIGFVVDYDYDLNEAISPYIGKSNYGLISFATEEKKLTPPVLTQLNQ